MLRKFGISCLLSIASVGYAKAGKINDQRQASDTVDIVEKDSLRPNAIQLKDPKDEFKSLQDASLVQTTGIDLELLDPHAIYFVEDYQRKYGKSVETMVDRSRSALAVMGSILVDAGLPGELKYLAVIESQLNSNARSSAGAVGPWQFMAGTARGLGLRVNRQVDERKHLRKSTLAASRYLKNLFKMYEDWLLVLAAYNSGPGTVNAAIRRSGSRNFWKLEKFLPLESRKHVKKYIATHYIMEGTGGLTTLTKEETERLWIDSSDENSADEKDSLLITQKITGRYDAGVIAKRLDMDLRKFERINPHFEREIASNGIFNLRLPEDKMELFKSMKNEILGESLQLLLNPDGASVSIN